jgi:UDP-N-acetylglucosamine 2-epimerase (non-hydrolysing)
MTHNIRAMKIISIIGARPQFIKCAPLSRNLRKKNEEILIHTGQHYDHDMSDIFFKELNIPKPDYNLNIGSSLHGDQTGRMLIELEKVILKERPDIVLVYGDTNSTLAGALVASKLNICLVHVEAGLRSFDRQMPEEINRVVTDHTSNILFSPTRTATINLRKEGIDKNVYEVGDVMADALNYNKKIAERYSHILDELSLTAKNYMLTTIHRPSNTDNRTNLSSIMKALCDLETEIVLPIHPRTENYLKKYDLWTKAKENIKIIPPLGYLDMLKLMKNSEKIITDSGGVQKEAYMLGIPCITLRENTEWVETVDEGWNQLVGAEYSNILKAVNEKCNHKIQKNIFGNGNSSEKISHILNKYDGYV